MRNKITYYRKIWLKYDLAAGLSVFFVALPLCLGVAMASGAPIYAGLLSGIIGGVLVSVISGSQLGVSGPAAGLSTVVAAAIISLGSYQTFLAAVMVAGLFQIVIGALKLGGFSNYFPSAVIKGMLAAIGILLISKQIPLILGYDQPDFWSSGFPLLFHSNNFLGNIENFHDHTSPGPIIIAAASLGVMILLKKTYAKKLKAVPAPLFVVIVGIGLNFLFTSSHVHAGMHYINQNIPFISLITQHIPNLGLNASQLVDIPANIFSTIVFPDLSKLFTSIGVWKDGIIIGVLATLETLFCVEAVDKIDKHHRITPINRELIAQGIGNMTCGLLGAIPMTSVVVRGAANADAGGRTKLSAFTHGLFLLLAVLLIPTLLCKIPYAALAAILLITGYNLTRPRLYIAMWKLGWMQFLPFVLTILVILSTDLLMGVSIGLSVSFYFIVQNNFKAEYKLTKQIEHVTEVYYLKLNSNVTFLNKVQLRKAIDKIPEYSILTIDGSECNYIDFDILEIISEYEIKARERHIELKLLGIERVEVTNVH